MQSESMLVNQSVVIGQSFQLNSYTIQAVDGELGHFDNNIMAIDLTLLVPVDSGKSEWVLLSKFPSDQNIIQCIEAKQFWMKGTRIIGFDYSFEIVDSNYFLIRVK